MNLTRTTVSGFLVIVSVSLGCNSSSTTDGRPNRGGETTTDESAEQQRGGTSADWSQGNGRPGSAPSSPQPSPSIPPGGTRK